MTTRRITVADVDTGPNGYPLAFTVEVTRETATAGDRGRVQVTVTNRGEDTFEFQTGFPGVFGGLHSKERGPGLFLYPTGETPPKTVSEDGRVDRHGGYPIPAYLQNHELDPKSSESVELDVLSDYPADPWGWIPEGTFTFRDDYTVGPVKTTEAPFEWGFSLAVESIA